MALLQVHIQAPVGWYRPHFTFHVDGTELLMDAPLCSAQHHAETIAPRQEVLVTMTAEKALYNYPFDKYTADFW